MTQPYAQVATAFDVVRVVMLFLTVGIAAVTDVLHRRVSNSITYPAIAFGLTLAFGAGDLGAWDGPGLAGHLVGMSVGFLIFFVAWFARAVQGGEVKLAAAVGALGGFPFVIPAIFWASIIGAIMALWMAILRGRLLREVRSALRYGAGLGATGSLPGATATPPPAQDGERALANRDPDALHVPYAVALAFGTIVAFLLQECRS
jgi:Flp pilus assembly protein protease CpaA